MKEEYLQIPELSSYNTYFKALGIDANSVLMNYIREESKKSTDEWFAEQMDGCFTDALKGSCDFNKYQYLLIAR